MGAPGARWFPGAPEGPKTTPYCIALFNFDGKFCFEIWRADIADIQERDLRAKDRPLIAVLGPFEKDSPGEAPTAQGEKL